jgi:NADH:ubiquinone reductase (H+-translocating)
VGFCIELEGKMAPQVVIVGAGFGGLWAAKTFANSPVDVVVVDRQNYHLFQPLLYQVATAGLSPADIAAPIRSIVGIYRNVTVMLGTVEGVDATARKVLIKGGRSVPYDYLVLATGARHAYFGHDDWEPFAPGLKRIEDATEIRRRILLAFEQAENETDAAERRRLMNLVIVGGGPTGVELAGAIAELARRALSKDFRNIDPRAARIILIEAGPRLLSTMPADLSNDAQQRLERLGVEVRLNASVTAVDAAGVAIGIERIEARSVIWAAGVAASPAGQWIGAESDRVGRIKVNPDLSVPGHPKIFAIGDTSLALDAAGEPLPGVASAAKQQGVYVGKLIKARLRGAERVEPFHYRNYGNLAAIGRKAAVVDFGWIHLRGFVAWVIWSVVHIYFLIGLRNRLMVALHWLWAYFTFQRGARLITERGFDLRPTPLCTPTKLPGTDARPGR